MYEIEYVYGIKKEFLINLKKADFSPESYRNVKDLS